MWTLTDILQWIVLVGVAIACGDVRARFAEHIAPKQKPEDTGE